MRTPAALLLVVGLAGPAGASPLDTAYCRLWPRAAACQPAPAPAPRPAPAPAPKAPVPAPKVDAGRPMPNGPVVAKPQAKPKAAVRAKVKAKPKAAKRKRVLPPRRRAAVVDEPGLPAGMCTLIGTAGRFGKTMNDVEAAARARGHRMNARQRSEASRCLNS